jgi:hypothetical protein
MSGSVVEVPKERLAREKVEWILARWEKKRRGLLGPLLFPDSCARRLTRIEQVYVPHFLFTFQQSIRSRIEVHYILIDALCGFGAFTNAEPELSQEDATGAVFAASLSSEKAQERAKDWLSRWNLRRHAFHLTPPTILSSRSLFFHFPFWLAFYERPSGRMDLEVVDGVRGFLEGGRTKYMINRGLASLGRTLESSAEELLAGH